MILRPGIWKFSERKKEVGWLHQQLINIGLLPQKHIVRAEPF